MSEERKNTLQTDNSRQIFVIRLLLRKLVDFCDLASNAFWIQDPLL